MRTDFTRRQLLIITILIGFSGRASYESLADVVKLPSYRFKELVKKGMLPDIDIELLIRALAIERLGLVMGDAFVTRPHFYDQLYLAVVDREIRETAGALVEYVRNNTSCSVSEEDSDRSESFTACFGVYSLYKYVTSQ